MEIKEFIEQTILSLDDELFDKLKEYLINKKYISFSFFSKDSISKEIFSEKLFDYFEVIAKEEESYDKMLKKYMTNWESVVGNKIEKKPKATKKNPSPVISRSRKYYDTAINISKEITIQNIVDYSRLMMCLYMQILNDEGKTITDFEYDSKCLKLNDMFVGIQKERKENEKKIAVNRKDSFFNDNWTCVILIIMFYFIKNNEVVGEY